MWALVVWNDGLTAVERPPICVPFSFYPCWSVICMDVVISSGSIYYVGFLLRCQQIFSKKLPFQGGEGYVVWWVADDNQRERGMFFIG